MATIIIRNSTGSGIVPSSLVQGELAINTKDGRLFYGSGSGNVVKEFTGSGGSGTSFPYTGSAIISGSLEVTGSFYVLNSIDSENRVLYDNIGGSSIDWQSRRLYTDNGNVALRYSNNYAAQSTIYYQQTIDAAPQESLSNNLLDYSGQAIAATIDVTSTPGDLVYLETDGIWYIVDQSTITSIKLLGINIDGTNVLLEGDVILDNVQTVDHGLPLYIKESNGRALSTTIPTSGYIRIVGHCYYQNTTTTSQWTVKFRPSNDWYRI